MRDLGGQERSRSLGNTHTDTRQNSCTEKGPVILNRGPDDPSDDSQSGSDSDAYLAPEPISNIGRWCERDECAERTCCDDQSDYVRIKATDDDANFNCTD